MVSSVVEAESADPDLFPEPVKMHRLRVQETVTV